MNEDKGAKMSSRKLDFKTWCNDIGIRECDQTTKCDDCKAAWDFAESQEKRENEKLKIKFSEATKTYTDDIDEIQKKVDKLEKENEALKKKLSEAVEVIKFYGNPEKWINRHKDSWDKCSPKNFGDEEAIADYAHPRTDWIGTVVVGGEMARAFLKENKDEYNQH